MKETDQRMRGLSLRNLNFVMSVITVVISVLLLIATYSANADYQRMRADSRNYILWQGYANDLQRGSDYLTEQVRCFVETGDRLYLDNYFEESQVTKRRDRAVERIHEFLGDSEAYYALNEAMKESMKLMQREYYAMRLAIQAYAQDASDYPASIQAVALSADDLALSRERQAEKARLMVFDDQYRGKKEAISQNLQTSLNELAAEMEDRQTVTSDRLQDMLFKQRALIIASISITVLMMLGTLLLIVSPLLRAVMFIRADRPIPIGGSNEFQFLARTYNFMFEANREQKEQLAYEATHDPLTGVYNRSGFDFFLKNTDWKTSALVLFSVDGFKSANDPHSQTMGDEVLKRVAGAITRAFRVQDYVCRVGDDAFAVIMVHVQGDLEALIKRKTAHINGILGRPEDGAAPVSVSCGAACGCQGQSAEQVFKDAEAALRRAKKGEQAPGDGNP